MQFQFSDENRKKIDQIKSRYPEDQPRAPLLMVLHVVQEEFGYIPEEMVPEVAANLGIPQIQVEEVVTFYPLFRWKDHGRRQFGENHLGICVTLSCQMGGCQKLVDHVRAQYGIEFDGVNQAGTLSLQEFQCLGSCHTAPTVLFNDRRVEGVDVEALDALLSKAGVEPEPRPKSPEAEQGAEENA